MNKYTNLTIVQLKEDLELMDFFIWLCPIALQYKKKLSRTDGKDYEKRLADAQAEKDAIIAELKERGEQIE